MNTAVAENSVRTSAWRRTSALPFMPMPEEKKIHKSGIDEANEDIKAGRVYRAKSVEDLFEQLDK